MHSAACHEGWACSHILVMPGHPPWPWWPPRHVWSQSCPMPPCSTTAGPHLGSPERQQRWKSPSKSLLPSQQGKHPLRYAGHTDQALVTSWNRDACTSSARMSHQHGRYSHRCYACTISPASASTHTLWIHPVGKMGTFEKSSSKVKWNRRLFQQKRSSRTARRLTPKARELLEPGRKEMPPCWFGMRLGFKPLRKHQRTERWIVSKIRSVPKRLRTTNAENMKQSWKIKFIKDENWLPQALQFRHTR